MKISAALVAIFVAVVAAVVLIERTSEDGASAATGTGKGGDPASVVVREDSHRLSSAADGRVTLVEFLDFECEACRAAFPFVEQLREQYEGKVTFVARYFPLPGHANGQNAALAVEAAAQQGKFEAMYQRMYQTQEQWGEQQTSQAPLFRTFAEDLDLDLAAYDQAVAAPATLERIKKDMNDGTTLGVQGTPTFFLNGRKIEPQSGEDFQRLIDDALAG